MNIQDRLRHCAKHTGLDAVVELLNEAATHIEGLNSTPKLQGDPSWWMRETDEGAERTDTAPLVLSGWTPLYTTLQPAQATQAEVTDEQIKEAFLANGFTIKDGHSDLKPYVYAAARAILALRPERVPMTEDQVWHNDALMSANGTAGFKMDALMRIVRATEAHHFGITTQPKGGE